MVVVPAFSRYAAGFHAPTGVGNEAVAATTQPHRTLVVWVRKVVPSPVTHGDDHRLERPPAPGQRVLHAERFLADHGPVDEPVVLADLEDVGLDFARNAVDFFFERVESQRAVLQESMNDDLEELADALESMQVRIVEWEMEYNVES